METLKKLLIFQEMKLFSPPPRKFLLLQETKTPEKNSYIFSKESFSYISGNGSPETIESFLYFGR